jgi:GNAT superfamily N-acetyltransferase
MMRSEAERLHGVVSRLPDLLEPLAEDDRDTRLWLDCEMASFAENRLDEMLDPAAVTDAERERALSRAAPQGLRDPHADAWFRHPYWLKHAGERVGTVALATQGDGGIVTLSSLYVFPRQRGRGLARAALRRVQGAAVESGFTGLRLATDWTWQRPLGLYLRISMWVANWKHDIVFTWTPPLGSWSTRFEGDDAAFEVEGRTLVRARRCGERLEWIPEHLPPEDPACWYAGPTFALALAVRSWPLIRSEEHWRRRHEWWDCGAPEGLAGKIELFEAVARRDGFATRTPRIPGLAYRDLDAID